MMNWCPRIAGLFLILVWILPVQTVAQEEDDPQQLPEIAPQEFEIRGELQLSFPSLRRQPLRGFESPATHPSVPAARTPYKEPYKQTLEQLPESVPEPETVTTSLNTSSERGRGFLQLGGGRYASRFAEGRLSVPLPPHQSVGIHFDYTGTEGFAPFADPDLVTPSDELHGRVRFETRHDAVKLAAHVGGLAERYTLYGASSLVGDANATAPEREGARGDVKLRLDTYGSVESTAEVAYDRAQYETRTGTSPEAPTTVFGEDRLTLTGDASISVGGMPTYLDATFSRSWLGGDVSTGTTYAFDVGTGVSLINTDRVSVRAGGRYLGFQAPLDPQTPSVGSASATFLVPWGRAQYTAAPGLSLHVQNTPGLADGSLRATYDANPYAGSVPTLRPTIRTTDVETGLSYSTGTLEIRTSAGYRYAPSYRYFQAFDPDLSQQGIFRAQHRSAQIVYAGGELALQGIDGLEASAGLTVRNGHLVGEDTAIPYFSPVVGKAMFSFTFANQRGRFQTTGRFESPRPTDPSEQTAVGTYVSFDLESSYQVTSLLDVIVQAKNLAPTAPTRWDRYPQPPSIFMGGFRIHW